MYACTREILSLLAPVPHEDTIFAGDDAKLFSKAPLTRPRIKYRKHIGVDYGNVTQNFIDRIF